MASVSKIQNDYTNKKLIGAFTGVKSFASAQNITDIKQARDALSSLDAYTLHKPVINKFQRRIVRVFLPQFQYSVDLMDVTNVSRFNAGVKFILICIDVFSKYLWVYNLKSKRGEEVAKGLEYIIKDAGSPPLFINSDDGREFFNVHVKALCAKYGIKLFSVHSHIKSALSERTIGWLRKRYSRYVTATGDKSFIKLLPDLVSNYNKTVQSSTKFTPEAARLMENQPEVWHNLYGKLVGKKPKPFEFPLYQLVRISHSKVTFQKSSARENWSREVFRIYKRYRSYPTNYYALKDITPQQEIIKGLFYPAELQAISRPATNRLARNKPIK